jgi:predicted Rossmann-fold nucleotide-binding protein
LTLMQTHKIRPFLVVLFDSKYWRGFLDWLKATVLARGYISEGDFHHVRVCDRPDDVIEAVERWYASQEVVGRKALLVGV